MTETTLHRRRILEAIGVGSVAALAGCSESGDGSTAEADEPAQNDTQESTEDAEDEENDEGVYKGLPTHPVDIRVVDREGQPQRGMRVKSAGKTPAFETPPTGPDGWTHVEIPASIPYPFEVVDGTETWYMTSIIHSEPENEGTEYDRLIVREPMNVIIRVTEGEEPEVISP